MDRIVEVKVNGSHVWKDSQSAGTQGEVNATSLRIEFDEGWDGFAKTITWWDAKGENPTSRVLTAAELENIKASTRIYLTPIVPEALAIWGKCMFSIDGYINGRRQRSAYASMVVKPCGNGKDITIEVPTPSQIEQLQAQIDTLLGDMAAEAIKANESANAALQGAASATKSAEEALLQRNQAAKEAENAAAGALSAAISSSNAQAHATGGALYKDIGDGTITSTGVTSGAKGYADQAKAYAEGGSVQLPTGPVVYPPYSIGAKGEADRARAYAEGGTYLDWVYDETTRKWKQVEVTVTGAKDYAAMSNPEHAVRYAPQDLTEEEQAQARKNIGADGVGQINVKKYGIFTDGTNAAATTAGINQALADAKADGHMSVVFPQGEYLVDKDNAIIVDVMVVDFNGSTIRKETNGNQNYEIIRIYGDNSTVKNADIYGDRETHDYTTVSGTHEWGICIGVEPKSNFTTIENVHIFDATGYGIGLRCEHNQIAPVRKAMALGKYDTATGALTTATDYTVLDYVLDVDNEKIVDNMFMLAGNGYGSTGIAEPLSYYMTFYDASEKYLGYSKAQRFYNNVDLESWKYKYPTLKYIKFSIRNTDTETSADIELRSSWCANFVTIRNVEIGRCRTLGIAVTGCKNLLVEHTVIHDTGGAAPGYGVDIEDGYQLNQYIRFVGCKFYGNKYGDITSVKTREIIVDGCEFQGFGHENDGANNALGMSGLRGLFIAKNSNFIGTRTLGENSKFRNCNFIECSDARGTFYECNFFNSVLPVANTALILDKCKLTGGQVFVTTANFKAIDTEFENTTFTGSNVVSVAQPDEYILRRCKIYSDDSQGRAFNDIRYAKYIEISNCDIRSRNMGDSVTLKAIRLYTPNHESTFVFKNNRVLSNSRGGWFEVKWTTDIAFDVVVEGNIFTTERTSFFTGALIYCETPKTSFTFADNDLVVTGYTNPTIHCVQVKNAANAIIIGNRLLNTCSNAIKVDAATTTICDRNAVKGTVTVPDGAQGTNYTIA